MKSCGECAHWKQYNLEMRDDKDYPLQGVCEAPWPVWIDKYAVDFGPIAAVTNRVEGAECPTYSQSDAGAKP